MGLFLLFGGNLSRYDMLSCNVLWGRYWWQFRCYRIHRMALGHPCEISLLQLRSLVVAVTSPKDSPMGYRLRPHIIIWLLGLFFHRYCTLVDMAAAIWWWGIHFQVRWLISALREVVYPHGKIHTSGVAALLHRLERCNVFVMNAWTGGPLKLLYLYFGWDWCKKQASSCFILVPYLRNLRWHSLGIEVLVK